MRHHSRAAWIMAVATAVHMYGCGTQIAPEIEAERRYQGTVPAPPPAPPAPFDMSLFLRKLAAGRHGVSGGFDAGPVHGSVQGALTGTVESGTFNGRLSAPETRSNIASTRRSGGGLLALWLMPSMALFTALQDGAPCVVEQEYAGEMTPTGLVWTPREVVRSCPTNPLNFTIAAELITQPPTTSVATTSSVPTTSVTTTSTTTSVATTTTTTSAPTTTTTTTIPTTTTSIPPI